MSEPPVLLSKWYEFTKWLLGRVDQFPKNQRFILGQRLVDRGLAAQRALNGRYATLKCWLERLRALKRPATQSGRSATPEI